MNIANLEREIRRQASLDSIERFVVGAAIINKNNEVLVLRRHPDDFMGGIDELPSGKIDGEENFETGLRREITEETGLQDIQIESAIGNFDYTSKSGKKTRQINFLIRYEGTEKITLSPLEHTEFKWVPRNKTALAKTKLTSNVIDLLLTIAA